jgi:hypothetical protein
MPFSLRWGNGYPISVDRNVLIIGEQFQNFAVPALIAAIYAEAFLWFMPTAPIDEELCALESGESAVLVYASRLGLVCLGQWVTIRYKASIFSLTKESVEKGQL